eukprot:2091833-Amphidinium_carterae.3
MSAAAKAQLRQQWCEKQWQMLDTTIVKTEEKKSEKLDINDGIYLNWELLVQQCGRYAAKKVKKSCLEAGYPQVRRHPQSKLMEYLYLRSKKRTLEGDTFKISHTQDPRYEETLICTTLHLLPLSKTRYAMMYLLGDNYFRKQRARQPSTELFDVQRPFAAAEGREDPEEGYHFCLIGRDMNSQTSTHVVQGQGKKLDEKEKEKDKGKAAKKLSTLERLATNSLNEPEEKETMQALSSLLRVAWSVNGHGCSLHQAIAELSKRFSNTLSTVQKLTHLMELDCDGWEKMVNSGEPYKDGKDMFMSRFYQHLSCNPSPH